MIKTHTLVVTIIVGNTGKQITESDIVTVKRGDIYYADLSPVVGSEQGGYRPVLIVQNDVGNKYSPTVIAAAITSRMDKTRLPTHIDVCRNDTDDSNTYGLDFSSEESRFAFLHNALVDSVIQTSVEPQTTDRVLTLSTCSGAGYSTRWVVHARLKMIQMPAS